MSNPSGLTPDGTVVGRVNRRDNNSGMMDALIKLFGEMLGRQKPNNTPENLRALRNDPIGDMNKQRDVDVAKVNNRFVQGFGMLGPNTAAMAENGMLAPEQLARMQGRTAMNQWRFPDMFKKLDAQNIAGVVAEHNQGVDYIKEQQSQMLPTVDFRERDPNLSGQYQGTNVRDFLIDQNRRQSQAKADGFDAAPANAIKSIIPKASHGGIPGYATRSYPQLNVPVGLSGLRFGGSRVPPVALPTADLNLSGLFRNTFRADNPVDVNSTTNSSNVINPSGEDIMAPFISYDTPASDQEFTVDKDGYKTDKAGVRYFPAWRGGGKVGNAITPEGARDWLSKYIFPKY